MKKVLTFVLFIALAFAANAQTAGAGPLVVCGEGESCPPDLNGHFSSGIVPYAPDVNSEYFPIIRACEPLDVCITMHCPQSIDLSAVGLGSNTINLRGIEVKGFGGLPEGVTYCLSNANWEPDGYYTIHLQGTPMQAGTYQLKLSAVLSGGTFLSVNTDLIYPNGMDAIQVTVQEATPLVAGFTADATEISAGSAVNFTNTSTGYQATRTWTFEGGNPSTSTDTAPRVIYSTPGTYQVSLTIKNACDSVTKTETAYITVTDAEAGEPEADFSFATTQLEEGFSVQFNDGSTNLPTSWSWTFENGTPATSTEQNPVVTFAEEGDYLVTLVAENEYGRDSIARTLSIVGINDYSIDNLVSIYPNPTSSILNIEAEDIISVTILDMSGKIIYFANENCSAASIDLEGFAKSEYMIKVETRKGTSVKRIIKM